CLLQIRVTNVDVQGICIHSDRLQLFKRRRGCISVIVEAEIHIRLELVLEVRSGEEVHEVVSVLLILGHILLNEIAEGNRSSEGEIVLLLYHTEVCTRSVLKTVKHEGIAE